MPSNESGMGKFSGYESVVFTADGGFIAGGFANGEHGSMDELNYKSGGQVDSGNPIAQKFSASVANTGKQSSPLSASGQGQTWVVYVGQFYTLYLRDDTSEYKPILIPLFVQGVQNRF